MLRMTTVNVKKSNLELFIKSLMIRAGSSETDALHLANVLIDADYRFSQNKS